MADPSELRDNDNQESLREGKYMNKKVIAITVCLTIVLLAACSGPIYSLTPNPTAYFSDSPAEYYLYLPSSYTPDKEWPLFVGIHGSDSDGTGCLRMWQEYAETEPFVLVCPSLADENGGWYMEQGEASLHGIIRQVREECHVQDKFFLAGFSAGAAFALAYTYDNPKSISAVAVLSSGIYIEPWKEVGDIPFLILIGEEDSPAGVEGARNLANLLRQNGTTVELDILPGIRHEIVPQTLQLTIDLYRRVYGILP